MCVLTITAVIIDYLTTHYFYSRVDTLVFKFPCICYACSHSHHHNALVLITLHKNVNYTVVHIFKVPLMPLIKLEMEPLYLQRPS